MTLPSVDRKPVVHVRDGGVFASSRDVAKFFGKAHKNVLADISDILTCGALSAENSAQWFQPVTTEVHVGFGVRRDPAFEMTRDGFTLLVMGYTGQKAMAFKVAYIEQFNAMEKALKGDAEPEPEKPSLHPAESLAVCNQFLAMALTSFPTLGERSRQALFSDTTLAIVGTRLLPSPVVDEPFFTTSQIAAEAGVSPQLAGKRAKAFGLKTADHGEVRLSKSQHSDKQVEQFYWNESGRNALLGVLRGLQ